MRRPSVDPVRLLEKTLRFYSPTTQEAELANFLADEMKLLGYSSVRTDRAGNVLGEAGMGRVRLLLCGHMDTVPGRLPIRRTKDSLSGRGAADAKSPMCALLVAGARAADAGISITFAGVTEEEGEGAGIEELIRARLRCDYAVFGEPSGADRVAIGSRGRVTLRVTVLTEEGHAGSPWAHRSAFDEFVSVMARLKKYERTKTVSGDHFRSLSVSPTLVAAGSHQNVVPGLCESTLDLRLPPSISSATAIAEIRAVAEASAPGVDVRVAAGPPTEAYEADHGSALVRAFERAIILRLKSKPRLVRKTGTGDMNSFAHGLGAACLTYGPGSSASSHSARETVKIKDYLNSIDVAEEAIRQLAAIGRSRAA